jgi:hypothetical protein
MEELVQPDRKKEIKKRKIPPAPASVGSMIVEGGIKD